jgi:2-polyprenyl-6-methoxyphenol hydroxylase-like FAD-dependent oxidoreductase
VTARDAATRVVVVGAGPVGLMLAGELRLGGAEVTVVEQLTQRTGQSRGVGFTALAARLLEQRGLLERLGNPETSRQGHFGGIPMDFGVLEGSHFGVRGVPQYRVEELLEAWARELGAVVLRGHTLVGLEQDTDTVVARIEGPGAGDTLRLSASYLVGCDGGHSTVRRLAGFAFPGTAATREMYLADVVGAAVRPRMIGERVPGGMVMSGPLEKDVARIIVCPTTTRGLAGESGRPRFAAVADLWEELTGESLHGAQALWISAFTDATRQAAQYRQGRVLLAGDAAHVHLPAGGQGMSLGIQDAVNLGWKLAAQVRGDAPEGLLDTYHAERHPVGARVLRNTLAQGVLYLSGPEIEPLRKVMAEIMQLPAAGRHLSGMVSGLDVRYDVDDDDTAAAHPLLGMLTPGGEIEVADGRVRVAELLHPARGLLLTTPGTPAGDTAGPEWKDRVDLVAAHRLPSGPAGAPPLTTLLLRPDGYVAWTDPGGPGRLDAALHRWFGRQPELRTP